MIWFRKTMKTRKDRPELCDMACRAEVVLRQLRDKQALDGARFR